MRYESFVFETSCGFARQLLPSDLPEIAFAGRSNVGKSSLLNRLLNRKNLARVSASPGKTATINFYKGNGVRLVDLPGYGYANVSHKEKLRWADLLECYFSSARNLRLVVQLVDMRHPITKEDRELMVFLQFHKIPFAVVMTKSDKLNQSETRRRLQEIEQELDGFSPVDVIPFSSLKGTGVQELKNVLETVLG